MVESNFVERFGRKENRSTLRHWPGPVVILIFVLFAFPALASDRYTERQLDALAARVGKIYWIVAIKNQTPLFLSKPTANAETFRPQDNESFEITDLAGRENKNPYYKVKFSSGREAFISPEVFNEQLNLGIASADPKAYEKKKAAEAAIEEKKRIDWIQAQPWPRNVKEAAIKRQVTGGMNMEEVKKILGNPMRVSKVKSQLNVVEEHWLYADGSAVVFINGLYNRLERPKATNETQPALEQKK
ncbi:MAG TPA: hypothetical protein VIE89_10480 [Candidatus Binatia bacterium]|jgi:hypothetical protein